MSDHNSDAFLFGLVIGGLVGAGLALLLTPRSGEENRGQIKTKGIELKDGLAEAGHQVQAQAAVWQEKGQQVTEAISRSKDSIVQAVGRSKDTVVAAVGSPK